MNYIFVFLGEFGYELLNWQGVIRKFATKIDSSRDKIIVCSRRGLEPFYECANKYIDISELSYFKNSAANMYFAHNPEINYYKRHNEAIAGKCSMQLMSKKDLRYQKKMKKQIINYTFNKLGLNLFQKLFAKKQYKFIFSSEHQFINDLEFGTKSMSCAGIYKDLNLDNNTFVQIHPKKDIKSKIEQNLGFNLNEKYILCQTGARKVIQRSKEHVEYKILKELSEKYKIVLLNFDTGRNLDSKSVFPNVDNTYIYNCTSFEEQSVLIANSDKCVFFTEGDFRSHNYLPPFMGKNVYSIAPKTVFDIGTTPIEFWNKNVFKFGGQIIPISYEELDDKIDLLKGESMC